MSSSAGMFNEIHNPAERASALCNYGCKVIVDHNIPARRYFRSGLEMIRMANVYYDEKDFESAFVLYSKFITLFVEKLPKHPGYKSVPATERDLNKKKLRHVFPLAEEIKKKLLKKYEKEEGERNALLKKQAAELALLQEKQRQEAEARRLQDEEKRLQDEQRQIETDKKWRAEQEAEYNRLQEEHRRKLAGGVAAGVMGLTIEDSLAPQVPDMPAPPSYQSAIAGENVISVTPSVPPVGPTAPSAPYVPDRSLKPASPTDPNMPSVDRTTKPSINHFTSTGGTTGNRHGLRDVIVPSELMVKFLNLALPNTTRNVETCGILCGKLAQNAFRITHLVLPKQSGTPDSCQTENEEELFDIQDKHDLITLGWIHTHPSQTAFLSSVDLHTHCSYQLMLPEAIAIVCAPKKMETGFFSLTADHGLDFISNCRQAGFHPHPAEPPLFEPCGHVKLDNINRATVIDLRR